MTQSNILMAPYQFDVPIGDTPGQILVWNGQRWAVSEAFNSPQTAIQWVGDSNFVTANETDAGNVGGIQTTCYQRLRAWRDDFDFVGSINAGVSATQETGLSSLGAWLYNAVGGQTIQGATSSYAGWIAAMPAPPDVIVDMLGTNDIMGGSDAITMMARRRLLDAAYAANAPNARVLSIGVPPFVAGTTTGANLAAWNAVRAAYNALFQPYTLSLGRQYINPDALGQGSYQPSGVHLNQRGQGALGKLVADILDSAYLGGLRRGAILPRRFRNRKPWGAVDITTNLDSLGAAAHAGFNPGTGSFAIAFDWRPTALGGGFNSICGYNAVAARPDFWSLYQTGNGLEVEFGTGTAIIANQAQELGLTVDTWFRVVVIAFRNGANSSVGLYLNGNLVGLAIGLAAWTFGAHAFAFGTTPGLVGCPAWVGRCSTYKGAKVPIPGSMTALRAVEEDYYNAKELVTGACAASFPINVSLADEISGNPPLVASAGSTLTAAWPAGTPQRPWEGIA